VIKWAFAVSWKNTSQQGRFFINITPNTIQIIEVHPTKHEWDFSDETKLNSNNNREVQKDDGYGSDYFTPELIRTQDIAYLRPNKNNLSRKEMASLEHLLHMSVLEYFSATERNRTEIEPIPTDFLLYTNQCRSQTAKLSQQMSFRKLNGKFLVSNGIGMEKPDKNLQSTLWEHSDVGKLPRNELPTIRDFSKEETSHHPLHKNNDALSTFLLKLNGIGKNHIQENRIPEALATYRKIYNIQTSEASWRIVGVTGSVADDEIGILEELLTVKIKQNDSRFDDQILSLKQNIAGILGKNGEFSSAEGRLIEVINVRTTDRRWGRQHPSTISAMQLLANLYEKQGKKEEVRILWENTESIFSYVKHTFYDLIQQLKNCYICRMLRRKLFILLISQQRSKRNAERIEIKNAH
jgi:hypothetical protein